MVCYKNCVNARKALRSNQVCKVAHIQHTNTSKILEKSAFTVSIEEAAKAGKF